jgi:hypothetical protein
LTGQLENHIKYYRSLVMNEIKEFCDKYEAIIVNNELIFHSSVLPDFMECFEQELTINLKVKGMKCYVPLSQILKKKEIEELKTFIESFI